MARIFVYGNSVLVFLWIGGQVLCPHETDLLSKALMHPEDF